MPYAVQEKGEGVWPSIQSGHHGAKPYYGTVAEVPKVTALGTQTSASETVSVRRASSSSSPSHRPEESHLRLPSNAPKRQVTIPLHSGTT